MGDLPLPERRLREERTYARNINREPVTVRLAPEDKAMFAAIAREAGLDAGTAGRQILELVLQRVRAGGDLIDVLAHLRAKPRFRVQAETAP